METDLKPFTMTRLVRNGSMVSGVPLVVKCIWTPINVSNLITTEGTLEDAQAISSCRIHDYCRGHLCISPSNGAYLIPYGFAVGGEIISSDGSLMNQALILGEKGRSDIVDHCFKKVAGKRGLMRKSCNGCRPTNTMRLVASPSVGPVHTIEIPDRVLRRSVFMYIFEDGRCSTRKLEVGDVIVVGRCPSQGADSALPMKVVRGKPNVNSVRIPLELCNLTNADFDGDELWMFVPMTLKGMMEAEQSWNRVWSQSTIKSVFGDVTTVAKENDIPLWLDPAMLSTMTFEEMSEHKGGSMYDSMMLKTKSWKQMYKIMISKSYWRSFMARSELGIVNTTASRHGLAGPYGFMRMGMMLGSCVNVRNGSLTIASAKCPALPIVRMPPTTDALSCSSAMTKLTKIMYQAGIDTSKHGVTGGKTPAINTLMSDIGFCYAITSVGGGVGVSAVKNTIVYGRSDLYTNLSAMLKSNGPADMIRRAYGIVSMIEEIDTVTLLDTERVAVAFFICFLSVNINSLVNQDPIGVMLKLGLDWVTSVTCSNVKWFKNVIRSENALGNVSMSTDISSVLGSIFIGNMSMITNTPSTAYRTGTVIESEMSTVSNC